MGFITEKTRSRFLINLCILICLAAIRLGVHAHLKITVFTISLRTSFLLFLLTGSIIMDRLYAVRLFICSNHKHTFIIGSENLRFSILSPVDPLKAIPAWSIE